MFDMVRYSRYSHWCIEGILVEVDLSGISEYAFHQRRSTSRPKSTLAYPPTMQQLLSKLNYPGRTEHS